MTRFTSYLNEQELLFDKSSVEAHRKKIERGIRVPFIKTMISTLGGKPSIAIKISLDDPKEWPNKIFENSRYLTFMLESEAGRSNLELISKNYEIKQKFRKYHAKSTEAAIIKINNFINTIK
jgi:hypothetical protein